jgi:hypothetical protein
VGISILLPGFYYSRPGNYLADCNPYFLTVLFLARVTI